MSTQRAKGTMKAVKGLPIVYTDKSYIVTRGGWKQNPRVVLQNK